MKITAKQKRELIDNHASGDMTVREERRAMAAEGSKT